jgi:tRNA(fMet)-specific endonuclease VapC
VIQYAAMLDTNIVSELMRSPQGPLRRRIESFGVAAVCVSIFTAAELRYGGLKKGSTRLSQRIEETLATLPIIPFETPADAAYARIRAALTSMGTPIGPVDFFIAAHALSLGVTLVTRNIGEFQRVPGLALENWLD